MILLRLLRHLFLLPVYVYQRTLSPLMPPVCRFEPSCSRYFVEAVRTRGILVGSLKGLWRLCRCHPLVPGGWDPVDPDEPPPWWQRPGRQQPGRRPVQARHAAETSIHSTARSES